MQKNTSMVVELHTSVWKRTNAIHRAYRSQRKTSKTRNEWTFSDVLLQQIHHVLEKKNKSFIQNRRGFPCNCKNVRPVAAHPNVPTAM